MKTKESANRPAISHGLGIKQPTTMVPQHCKVAVILRSLVSQKERAQKVLDPYCSTDSPPPSPSINPPAPSTLHPPTHPPTHRPCRYDLRSYGAGKDAVRVSGRDKQALQTGCADGIAPRGDVAAAYIVTAEPPPSVSPSNVCRPPLPPLAVLAG